KCGYISFDQEEACTKCDASLAEISRSLGGTAVRVQESFFLASVLGQAGQQAASEEVEFDLAEAETLPESDVEIEVAEDEEGIPMVDLSPFEQQEEAAVEEYTGISFTLPEEEAEEEQVVEAAAGEEEQPAELGAIDFTFGEEPAHEEELQPAAEEAAGLDLSLEEAEVAALETEESLPELELEMGSVAEESLEPGAGKTAAAAGSGLDLDIDVDLEEDEPSDEEMVFNLEDIDMSDLVIDEPGGTEEETGRPEDTALNLEDFLSSGKGRDSGIPMDLTMEDVDLGDDEQDKKSADQPDIEL
ncbi:MAG: hypothetical protein MUO63_02595, partial [Desulfobulbaceae bacterium]|nr:hypothetical protein [Desulfobulbaceae bacterium]